MAARAVGVVAGRPHDDERGVARRRARRVDRARGRSRRPRAGGVVRSAARRRCRDRGAAAARRLPRARRGSGRRAPARARRAWRRAGTGGERILKLHVLDAGEDSTNTRRPLRMSPAGVVQIGPGRGDEERSAAPRRPGSAHNGVTTRSLLRRSITRGTRRRRPSRRPASMRPSTTPTRAPTSISTRKAAGSSPAKNTSAARSITRCTRNPGRIEPDRRATYPSSTARLRNGTRLAAPVICSTWPGRSAEHETPPTRPPMAGPLPRRRGVTPVAPGEPGARGADQRDRGEPVHEFLAGDRDHDTLHVAPGGHGLRVRNAPDQRRSVRPAAGIRATPAGCGARTEVLRADQRTRRSAPRGSAGDIDTRPRYHWGSPHHDVLTSRTTAAAQTQRTSRRERPRCPADPTPGPTRRRPGGCSFVGVHRRLPPRDSGHDSGGRLSRVRPRRPRLGKGLRGSGRQARWVANHSSVRRQPSAADSAW